MEKLTFLVTLAIFSRHVKIPSNIANHTRQAKMNCQAIKIPNGHAIISILASVYADSRSFENWCKILYHKPIENIEFRMKFPATFKSFVLAHCFVKTISGLSYLLNDFICYFTVWKEEQRRWITKNVSFIEYKVESKEKL